MAKKNLCLGSNFESWLDEKDVRDEVVAAAVYALTADERKAIAEARKSAFASDDEVAAFWKRVGIKRKTSAGVGHGGGHSSG
ncbi:hypothetical protein MXD81_64150 [Microbacteriaceae bacterium K1510]|nr:hypothetical protein [Microbacteriaceae bacterium K1510]